MPEKVRGIIAMSNFIQNWTYPKHAFAVTSLYFGLAVVGNACLGKRVPEDEKSLCPTDICRNMTKKQIIFNAILSGCYSFDMSVTYLVLNHFKKQYK
jgi:hypothetical protein